MRYLIVDGFRGFGVGIPCGGRCWGFGCLLAFGMPDLPDCESAIAGSSPSFLYISLAGLCVSVDYYEIRFNIVRLN